MKSSTTLGNNKILVPRIAVAVAVGSLTANENFAKFFRKTEEKGPPFTFSSFQSCCGWRLRLTANRKLAVAVAVGNFDRNSGYGFNVFKPKKLESSENITNKVSKT